MILPPPESGFTFTARKAEKFEPVPDPYLKSRASRDPQVHDAAFIDQIVAETFWIKQACGCGCS